MEVKEGSTPCSDESYAGGDEELFQIIDETGEGFGFDLTPQTLMRPIAIGTSALFGVGMLAGIPLGVAMGRAQENDRRGVKGGKPRPTMAGLKFAASTFGLGTLLCGAMGVAGFYGLKWYYEAETFEDFGKAMKKSLPARRREIEVGLQPILDKVRNSAGGSLPGPMRRLQDRFHQSRLGIWMKEQVDASVTMMNDNVQAEGEQISTATTSNNSAES